jgi:Domain of unknown function (DUF4136)
MRKLRILLLMALLLGTLAADERQVDFDQQTDFSQYKTFMIGAARITTNKPELKTPIVKERVESAIRSQLQQKGLREVSSQPDLIVNYSLGAANKAEAQTWVGPRGRRRFTGVNRFTEGTLIIDLRDRPGRQLVWRGIYRDDERDAAKVSHKLPDDIRKLFDKYPKK